ncbi:MAG TPA: carboxypeptidase regulatory-like domain-containing protein [Terriglobales bacterium]|nr:carboxypeptidase regulatory-like domain-containing protein [Terriglobales bacterium]
MPGDGQLQQISGRIEDTNGNPLQGAVVELHSWSGGLIATESTNGVGAFEFRTTNSGPFELHVTHSGATETMQLESGANNNLTLRVPSDQPVGGAAPAAANSTVSLNDLEAPGKARSKLADAQKALGKLDFAKAWKLVNQAITAAPNWGRAYVVRGVISMENRNFAAAHEDLAKAVQHDPQSSLALTELGKLDATIGNMEEANYYLRRALSITPVLWPTYFEVASLDLKRGNYQEAAAMANYAEFATPPAPPAAHYLAGDAAFHMKDWAAATIEFRSFLALTPPSPEVQGALDDAKRLLAQIPATASVRHEP